MYQGIAAESGRLDNIVELRRGALPDLPFLPPNEPATATLTLKHAYSIVGNDTVEITFIGTNVNVNGEPLCMDPKPAFEHRSPCARPNRAAFRCF